MLGYATRKLLISIPVLFFATLVAFLLVATVDPIAEQRVFLLSQPDGAEQVARLETSLGLDKPLIERYGSWVGDLFRGDMGSLRADRKPVRVGGRNATLNPRHGSGWVPLPEAA